MKTLRVCVFEGEKQEHRNVTKNRRKVCGVVKERVTSINPIVVGSIPTGCESCRSSVAEQRKKSRAADSRHNKTDVVEVRVTSSKRALRATGEMRHRKAACFARGNSSNNQARTDRSHRISRDGAEKGYFVCETTRDCGPATLLDFPPGTNLPKGDEVGRGEGQGYFAYYAGGRGFESHLVHRKLTSDLL